MRGPITQNWRICAGFGYHSRMDEPIQLDLTTSVTNVPQANNLGLFIRLMEDLSEHATLSELVEKLEIDERTVQFYADFGRWLGFVEECSQDPRRTGDGREWCVTQTGQAFADSVPARPRLFSKAMFSKPLIQMVQSIKRDSADAFGVEQITTREACEQAIRAMTKLAESTIERRASATAHMLEVAYQPSRIDWSTGEVRKEYRSLVLDFPGRTFLTSMAARQFATDREIRIGFPKQVHHFVLNEGHGLSPQSWGRASWESQDKNSTWFGPVPVTTSTMEAAERGGRDLRRLLVACVPYVTLLTSLLVPKERGAAQAAFRMTLDMYGLKVWHFDRELGGLIDVVEHFAREAKLSPTKGIPKSLSHAPEHLTERGGDTELLGVLMVSGIVREKGTTFELAPGFLDELREGSEENPPLITKIRVLQAFF